MIVRTVTLVMVHPTPKIPQELFNKIEHLHSGHETTLALDLSSSKKPAAIFLIGQAGVQLYDLTTSWAWVFESAHWNPILVAVAPNRTFTATTGPISVLPHYLYDDLKKTIDSGTLKEIDLLVLPAVLDPYNQDLKRAVQALAPLSKKIWLISDGSQVAAEAQMIKPQEKVTAHPISLKSLAKKFPELTWTEDQGFVDQTRLISSAGGYSTHGAAHSLLTSTVGAARATEISTQLMGTGSAPHVTPPLGVSFSDFGVLFFSAAFEWSKREYSAVLTPGFDELAFAGLADTIFRSLSASVTPLAIESRQLRSARGLDWVVPMTVSEKGFSDHLFVLSETRVNLSNPSSNTLENPIVKNWVNQTSLPVSDFTKVPPGAISLRTLDWLETQFGTRLTEAIRKLMVAPKQAPETLPGTEPREIPASVLGIPLVLLSRPLLLAVFGLWLGFKMSRRFFRP